MTDNQNLPFKGVIPEFGTDKNSEEERVVVK